MDQVVEELRDHCVVLTGCRKGVVRQALAVAVRGLRSPCWRG